MNLVPWSLWLLIASPVCAILAVFFFVRPRKPQWSHWPILGSCALVCLAATDLTSRVYAGMVLDVPVAIWMLGGDWYLPFGFRVDGLGTAVLLMVAWVGALIQVYASGYMKHDPGFSRFVLLFHLFYLAMIGLLVSNNFVQLYLFWELVGVCSYFLIGFWYQKESARRAALQAFLANRVGDFGLMLAVLLLMAMTHGNTSFSSVFRLLPAAPTEMVTLAAFLVFWAATAKSAQFPLYFWLPDAMEGPTPVSALMHAATMVTAGIFLLVRAWPLISSIELLPQLIGWVGAATAIGAGLVACAKTDLKRVLAYSTVSHLGIMAFALGFGETAPAVFHLLTHGFFKAVLFLCVGNIAHALGKASVGVDETGGLAAKMPLTFGCFTAAALSLAGLWPFAGFYSKDSILDAAFHQGGLQAAAGVAIAFLSSFYIFRMLFLSFLGPRREQRGPGHAHEGEPVLGIPVFFLSLGAVGAGWLSGPLSRLLASGWMLRTGMSPVPDWTWNGLFASQACALAGVGAAYFLTTLRPQWDWDWRRRFPRVERLLESDFGWKPTVAAFSALVVEAAGMFSRGWDTRLWDGLVESTADWAKRGGERAASLATGQLNDYLWWMLAGTTGLLYLVLR
ncbi:MAG: NADH-quinone oxidoreductase subunit L [Elusimicrobia bacterium]|nr:NADH-quinone oxidoreductase subunit L [Elusimicrobiota bacterium]